jgi:hypothetical protein
VVHLSPLPGTASLRLEGQGLFSKRVRAPRGLREGLVPGLYRVVLHPRTDGEGFLTGLHLAHRELLSPAPVGEAPGEPLRFLLRRPHLAPAPGGLVLALGRVERGRLVGEAFPLTPRALP